MDAQRQGALWRAAGLPPPFTFCQKESFGFGAGAAAVVCGGGGLLLIRYGNERVRGPGARCVWATNLTPPPVDHQTTAGCGRELAGRGDAGRDEAGSAKT